MGLADAAAYDDRYKKWRYENLPILPAPFRYVVSEKKAAQFHILRSLMERPDVTELVNACDAGREGELIFRRGFPVFIQGNFRKIFPRSCCAARARQRTPPAASSPAPACT